MDKWKNRYLMAAAVVTQFCAALGYIAAVDEDPGFLLIAIPLSVFSLLLARRAGPSAAPKIDPVPAPAEPRPHLEEMILTLQEDVNRLREDREFYRELYVDGPRELDMVGEGVPVPRRELTYRLVPERSGPPQPPSTRSR